jgi:hypothetical protein
MRQVLKKNSSPPARKGNIDLSMTIQGKFEKGKRKKGEKGKIEGIGGRLTSLNV